MNTNCRRCKNVFLVDETDQIFYQKMKVPNPTVCPDCRFMMRAMWRNETTLYSRTCDMCQKNIMSMYNSNSLYLVYCDECYKSEKWDSKEYAKHYNYSESFFEQFAELLQKVPKASLYVTHIGGPNINSPYNNGFGGAKNCYFLFNGGPAEETIYSRGVKDCKDISDGYFSTKVEYCYEIVNTHNSSKIFFGQNVTNSTDSYFLYNCSSCINCFGCVNLRNKSYCWFNEQLAPEEYNKKLKEVLGSYQKIDEIKKQFNKFKTTFPHRQNNNLKSIESTGDYLLECKNVSNSLEVSKAENCKDIFSSKEIKESIGVFGYGFASEFLLETTSTGHSSNIIGSHGIDYSSEILYSCYCYSNNNNLIGCDSLKNASYCILNKQYSKEEYEKIKDHIVKELTDMGVYGLMLPPELSPFGYNETIGADNMPLSKEEALKRGFKWQDDIQKTTGKGTLDVHDIPDNIRDVADTITGEILTCTDCDRNYKITEQELFFYKRMMLPIPRKCFFCRHHDRIVKRGPYQFWNRSCALCKKDIVTNYAPDTPEIIYCEDCYRAEVL